MILCSVCGSEIGIVSVGGLTNYVEFAVIGAKERLCMGEDSCFGWFSGYPWVLFEMGYLYSDLKPLQLTCIRVALRENYNSEVKT